MKIIKPNFWSKINIFSILLYPFSLIFSSIIFLKKYSTRQLKFEIPIICVGNIYLGGTGKTPSSIFIANKLKKIGKNPVIIRKFYKNHFDEHELIRENFRQPILNSKRQQAIFEAQKKNFDSVILDDGFQDYKIKKNLNIICFNQKQKLGNSLVLPAGPLRENLSSLKNAHLVIINGKKDIEFENKLFKYNSNLEIFYSTYIPENINNFKNKKILAVAGIGNPTNFFDLLNSHEIIIEKKMIFPDHYSFSKEEISNIIDVARKNNLQIIMTEKDYYRIKDFNFNEIKFLKLKMKLENEDKFFKRVLDLYV